VAVYPADQATRCQDGEDTSDVFPRGSGHASGVT
jgi:hypothetical protein